MSTPVTALVSPEVHADRTVTLRFRAPQATVVQLVGEITQGRGPQPMTKDAEGLWTITVGPLPPEIWSYNFRVHGVDVVDPSNPAVKPTPPGAAMSSFVEGARRRSRPSTIPGRCRMATCGWCSTSRPRWG